MPGTITTTPTKAKVGDSLIVNGTGFGTAATLSTNLAGANNDLTFTAVVPGTGGNSIAIVYADPGGNNAALSVTVGGSTITVHLATGGGGAITSTAAQIAAAIAASAPAAALVTVANKTANDGTGVVVALGSTPLAGGAEANVELELIHTSNAQDDVREVFATTNGAFASTALIYRLEAPGDVTIKARVAGAVIAQKKLIVRTVSG